VNKVWFAAGGDVYGDVGVISVFEGLVLSAVSQLVECIHEDF